MDTAVHRKDMAHPCPQMNSHLDSRAKDVWEDMAMPLLRVESWDTAADREATEDQLPNRASYMPQESSEQAPNLYRENSPAELVTRTVTTSITSIMDIMDVTKTATLSITK